MKQMTTGNPFRLILFFALPLMLGNILQEFYTIVDTIVVGQFLGVKALASMGAAAWIHWMFISIVSGFAQGFSIRIANLFGANDQDGVSQTTASIILINLCFAFLFTIGFELFISPILHILQTPSDVIDGAILYLRIMAGGITITLIYNNLSCILRAFGNGKAPLIAMVIAALLNISLDIIFVYLFHMHIEGVAIATLISQVVASIFCFITLLRYNYIKLKKEYFIFQKEQVITLLKLGAPLAASNAIISIGGMVVQFVVNRYGFLFVAGFTATNKLYGLLETAAISFSYALVTFTSQNLGAKKYQRIKAGIKVGNIISLVTAIVVSLFMILLGRNILLLFISGSPNEISQVLKIAYHYLFIMAICLPILYLLYVYRSFLQGIGNTFIPMCAGIVEMFMRIGVALFLPLLIGQEGIYYAEVVAWSGATILLYISYKKTDLTKIHSDE